jgi:hypothetical protein
MSGLFEKLAYTVTKWLLKPSKNNTGIGLIIAETLTKYFGQGSKRG